MRADHSRSPVRSGSFTTGWQHVVRSRPGAGHLAATPSRINGNLAIFGFSEISLAAWPKSVVYACRPATSRGAFSDRHGRGRRDAVDPGGAKGDSACMWTAKSCGPDTPTLVSSS